ncbi:unnamed protein product [Meloidogyne enterolobii]|uniref:Uncharacterized protein n=1 Tax=Meloidogyne enterolobii TaxID=390850 RepID=A0ACB0Z0M6_MELEN
MGEYGFRFLCRDGWGRSVREFDKIQRYWSIYLLFHQRLNSSKFLRNHQIFHSARW